MTGLADGRSYSERYRGMESDRSRNKQTVVARERARLLSLATNKRRRAIEERRTKEEQLEEARREAILNQRREWQQQATIRFQRAHLPPEMREYKITKFRSRTPPRSISVEDALRAIQQQKYERSSSYPRKNSDERRRDGANSPPRGHSNNSSLNNSFNGSSPVRPQTAFMYQQHKTHHQHVTRETQSAHKPHDSSKLHSTNHRQESGHTNGMNHVNASHVPVNTSHMTVNTGHANNVMSHHHQTEHHVNNLHANSAAVNVHYPHNGHQSNVPPQIDREDSFRQHFAVPKQPDFRSKMEQTPQRQIVITTTTSVTPFGHNSQAQNGSGVYQKPTTFPQTRTTPASQDARPSTTAATIKPSQPRETPPAPRPKSIIEVAKPPPNDNKSLFEKQLALQQQKLMEMQQKTVEEFQKVISPPPPLENHKPEAKDDNAEDMARDSLDDDSEDDSPRQVIIEKGQGDIRGRPQNPAPANSTGEYQEQLNRAASSASKFRTPQSTATITAEEAKNFAGRDEVPERKPEPTVQRARPNSGTIKRKPLPVNAANTVSVVSKPPPPQLPIVQDPPMSHPETVSIAATTAPPVVNEKHEDPPVRTQVQYIAYTPIRKWDTPTSVSPKPVAEVAPVPSTPPQKEQDEPPPEKRPDINPAQLKHSAVNYMKEVRPEQTAPTTVGFVIDPSWSVYKNQKASSSSPPTGNMPLQKDVNNNQPAAPASKDQQHPISDSPPQKSFIPVPVSKPKPKEEPQPTPAAPVETQPTIPPKTEKPPTGRPDHQKKKTPTEDNSRSRPEIRSSSPYDRLVDSSNPDDIEEIENIEETRIKGILKRTPSFDDVKRAGNGFNVKDSLDLAEVKRVPSSASIMKPSSGKRSVRFNEKIQVTTKDDIDERPKFNRSASMRGQRTCQATELSRPTIAGVTTSHLKPGHSSSAPEPHKPALDEPDFNLNKTPTDDEINELWESIRENMPAGNKLGVTKPPVYVSSNPSAYYSTFIRNTQGSTAVASHYIDGSNIFGGNRAQSSGSIPRRQQPLLNQRQQYSSNARITPQRAVNPHLMNGNPKLVPSTSQGAPSPGRGRANDPVSASLAQFLAAEDLANMSLNEAQIEDILSHLQGRQMSQLSLEEQRLMQSLEQLNNKLKVTEAKFKGQTPTVQQETIQDATTAAAPSTSSRPMTAKVTSQQRH